MKRKASTSLGALLHLGKGKRTDWLSWVHVVLRPAHALTVDEIIKLNKAGVSDTTINLLIERDGSARAAGAHQGRLDHPHNRSARASSLREL